MPTDPVNVAVPGDSSTARLKKKLAPPEISKRTLVNLTLSLSDVTWNSYGPSTTTVVIWERSTTRKCTGRDHACRRENGLTYVLAIFCR